MFTVTEEALDRAVSTDPDTSLERMYEENPELYSMLNDSSVVAFGEAGAAIAMSVVSLCYHAIDQQLKLESLYADRD